MTDKELMQQALEALEWNLPVIEDYGDKEQLNRQHKSIAALRERLAQPEQEPVAWEETDELECPVCKLKGHPYPNCGHIAYTTPPRREWVGLTDEEIDAIWDDYNLDGADVTRAIEAKLKEKNE